MNFYTDEPGTIYIVAKSRHNVGGLCCATIIFLLCPSNPFFKPQSGGNIRVQGVGCRQNGEEWFMSLKCVQIVRSLSKRSSFMFQLDQVL
jgi:hypothetical protein